MSRVLLLQPRYPIPRKSHYHRDYLPVGLLKLAAWRRSLGDDVKLAVAGDDLNGFVAHEVYVTSLFTYWSEYVRQAVASARGSSPHAHIVLGGIYASLAPEHCMGYTGCDEVYVGVHSTAEAFLPAYDLVESPYQIVHASRGCIRRCKFCGTHQIEPDYAPKESIADEICKNHVVFYDNNLLANPHIETLLGELADIRVGKRVIHCESQSGIDGRILEKKPELGGLMRSARFRYARIAWDGPLSHRSAIRDQLEILKEAGYSTRQLQVFMLYNHSLSPQELCEKVETCFEWGIQVSDCRYRPLDRFNDPYDPRATSQDSGEYYVHDGWTDADVRGLRRAVRTNNICVRYGIPRERYSQKLERIPRAARAEAASGLGLESLRHDEAQVGAINASLLRARTG